MNHFLRLLPTLLIAMLASTAALAPAADELPSLRIRDTFITTQGLTPPLGSSLPEHRMTYPLYEGLTALDITAMARGESKPPVPSLAQSWVISPDGRTYTFKIRRGVKFTTGRPLNAQAVKKSLERTIAVHKREAVTAFSWTDQITSIDALDEMTLRMTLSEAYGPMLAALAAKAFLIVDADELAAHQETTDKGPDLGIKWGQTHSAGTGPFYVEEFIPEQRLTMRRNPNYWGGFDGVKPSVERLIWVHVPENATAELMIGAGEVDVALVMDPVSLKSLGKNPNVKVVSYPSFNTCNILVDRRTPPFVDDRGLQALRYAIDYEGLRDVVALGQADIHQSLILPGMLGHDRAIASKYKYDPAKAKALLAEIGYPNGFDIKIQVRPGSCGSIPYDKALQFLQNSLKAAGIRATIEQSTGAKMWGAIFDGSFRDIGISSLGATYFDADQPASWRGISECFKLGLDSVDPATGKRLTALTKMGRVELNQSKRHDIYKEVSQLMTDKCGEVTIVQVRDAVVTRSTVSNVVAAPHFFGPDPRYMKKAK
jgi:peptide/nickel transport system substrate-binding protein